MDNWNPPPSTSHHNPATPPPPGATPSPQFDPLPQDWQDYMANKIGGGGFGEVFKGKYRDVRLPS